jgi:hypothetical protein
MGICATCQAGGFQLPIACQSPMFHGQIIPFQVIAGRYVLFQF